MFNVQRSIVICKEVRITITELTETPLLPPGFKIPTTRYVHPSVRMRQFIETEAYLFGPGIYDPTKSHHFFSGVPYHHLVGKMHDASRLGQEFV
jgi:hypothetical protein